MGSHYIPVGKIKIDKEILDFACPAAGFIPDPEVFVPPFPMPELQPQSIVFICNAATANWRNATNQLQFSRGGTVNPYLYELFDDSGTLVDSWTDSQKYIDFDFPFNDRYYTVRVTLPGGSFFTGCYHSSTIQHDDCIEAVLADCPHMSQFSINGCNQLTNIELSDDTWASLNGLAYLVDGAIPLTFVKIPYSLISPISIYSAFRNTAIQKIDMSALNAPSMNLAEGIFSGCKYLQEVIMPNTWYGNRNYGMFNGTIRLAKVVLPTVWSPSGTPNNSMANFFNESAVEGELEFPSMPYITTVTKMFYNAKNITVIRLKGDWSGLTYVSYMITNCSSLELFEAPRTLRSSSAVSSIWSTSLSALKTYIGPDVGIFASFPVSANLESITGEHDTSGFSTLPNISLYNAMRNTLHTLQAPKLRVQRFFMGTASASYTFTLLTTMEIDWANSDWSSTSSPQLMLNAAFDATELNRIMTALPTVTGKTLDFRYCDGYASMNASIATTKGWTVL